MTTGSAGDMARIEKLYEEILLEASPNRMDARIAATYAEALLNIAEKRGQAESIGAELDSIVEDAFVTTPDLELLLSNPSVHRRRKLEIIAKAFAGKCSPLLEDFLRMLIQHERLTHLRLIAVSYQSLRDQAAKRVRILVESAVPIDADQLDKLRTMLASALHLEPVLINRVRPELLGGLLLHVGDKVFDSTVRHKLDSLRTLFLARGSHEIQTRRDRFGSN